MIRNTLLGALMLSLAAGSPAKAADDPFIDKLSGLVAPYVFCIQAEALAIDDGVSDALTIGGAAMDICRPILTTTKSWFLALPKLTADQREKARIYLDGTEPQFRQSNVARLVLQNRVYTRGATRKDVDAIWPAFRPYFTCVEQKLNTLKPQIEVMDEVFVILGAVSEEKICLEQFQAIRGDFIARHKSWNSDNLLKITEMVRTYAGFEASFDRISGDKISIP